MPVPYSVTNCTGNILGCLKICLRFYESGPRYSTSYRGRMYMQCIRGCSEWHLLQLPLMTAGPPVAPATAACTLLFKSNGIFFLRWQNMVFIFKVQTWNFVCGIRRSFALTMENILSVWCTATPGWTSKFGKVWKTRCQNAATRAIIWRCFLVSWDDKYLWVMVSNNRHELYFCSKLLCFSSIHCFFWPNTVSKYQTWTNSYLIPSNA